MSERCVYLRGQFVGESEARIPVRDSGWFYGETLTTTLRTFAHRPCRVDDHVAGSFGRLERRDGNLRFQRSNFVTASSS